MSAAREALITLGDDGSRGSLTMDKARTERLKAALRENLKRRKAQARGREAGARRDEPAPPKVAASGEEGRD